MTGLPEGASARLALFAKWTETTAPASIFAADNTLDDAFQAYATSEGLSFDWVLFGDVRGLVMNYRACIRGEV